MLDDILFSDMHAPWYAAVKLVKLVLFFWAGLEFKEWMDKASIGIPWNEENESVPPLVWVVSVFFLFDVVRLCASAGANAYNYFFL